MNFRRQCRKNEGRDEPKIDGKIDGFHGHRQADSTHVSGRCPARRIAANKLYVKATLQKQKPEERRQHKQKPEKNVLQVEQPCAPHDWLGEFLEAAARSRLHLHCC